MSKKITIFFLSLGFVLAGCSELDTQNIPIINSINMNENQPSVESVEINNGLEVKTLMIKTAEKVEEFSVEIADNYESRKKGLMYRESLPEKFGMLFVFENVGNHSFWMKNTLIPLDMIFIDEDFQIVYIKKIAEPCKSEPCSIYLSNQQVKYVLEINAGLADRLNIQIGDKVTWLD